MDLLPDKAAEVFNQVLDASDNLAFIGGGFLRDTLEGVEYSDVDIFVPAEYESAVRAMVLLKDEGSILYKGAGFLSTRVESHPEVNVVFVNIPLDEILNFAQASVISPQRAFFCSAVPRFNLSINRVGFNPEEGIMYYMYSNGAPSASPVILAKELFHTDLRVKQVVKVLKTMAKHPTRYVMFEVNCEHNALKDECKFTFSPLNCRQDDCPTFDTVWRKWVTFVWEEYTRNPQNPSSRVKAFVEVIHALPEGVYLDLLAIHPLTKVRCMSIMTSTIWTPIPPTAWSTVLKGTTI